MHHKASRKLKRRLAIWVRRRRHAAFQTWRENAHDKQWRLALACGRVYQCMRRRSRWRRRAAWRIWCERVKDIPRACQLLSRLLHRSAISRLMGAFRQWNDHYSFMYELHKALGKSVLKQKQELLETQRKLKLSRNDAQQSNGAGVCSQSHAWKKCYESARRRPTKRSQHYNRRWIRCAGGSRCSSRCNLLPRRRPGRLRAD